MKNKKILSTVLAGFMAVAISGCGSSASGDPKDKNPIEPKKDMTSEQAKDAMALNALFYPVLTPLQSCLDDLPSCIGLNFSRTVESDDVTTSSTISSADMSPGEHNCTSGKDSNGKYTVSEDPTKLVVTFGTDTAKPGVCIDDANSQDIEGELMSACIGKIFSIGNSNSISSVNTAGYQVGYEGEVTCTKDTSVVFENYIVSRFGQSDPKNHPNRYTHNMTVSKTNGLEIDGTYHAERWAPSGTPTDPKINDELWTFEKMNFSSGGSAGVTIMADGGVKYLGTIREGDNANNGMELSIDFTNLTYSINGSPDADVTVSGGIKASCHPEVVTYATTETLKDVDLVRDDEASRMPSAGSMSMTLPGYTPVPALFSAPSSTAQVAITSGEGTVDYSSWRSITTTSSCSVLQKIIDRIIPPRKPIASIDIQRECDLTDDATRTIDASNPLQLTVQAKKCLNAWATYRDGSRERVTTAVFWKSNDRTVATVDLIQRNSNVSGRKVGNTEITATLSGTVGIAPVEVQ